MIGLLYYLVFFVILLLLELYYFRIADRYNIIDRPNDRSSHTRVTLRGGGIVFYLGGLTYFFMSGFAYPWFHSGLTLVAGISFLDDLRPVPNRYRLFVHFLAMSLMFYQWGLFAVGGLWYIVIALVLCTGIINVYNFMDGINGITGGYSLVVLVSLLYMNRRLGFIDEHFLVVSMLSVLVFNLFNFRKEARCFAGDVGSIGIAFIILFALGRLVLQSGDISYVLFLVVYGIDSVLTIVHRIMLRENIGEAHRKHMYQLMSNELGMSHVSVALIYMGVQLLISLGLVVLPVNKWLYGCAVILLLVLCYVLFIRKYYHLHEEYLGLKNR